MSRWGSPEGKAIKLYVSSTPPSSASPAGPEQQALDRSGPRRTRTASPGSHQCLPEFNCECEIAVVSKPRIRVIPAGPEQQAPDQCILPDPNGKR